MTTLDIAPGFSLPLDAATETFGILAKKGAGKLRRNGLIESEGDGVRASDTLFL